MLDILIKNGWVVDGTGNPGYRADVGIQGNRVVEVKKGLQAEAERTVDASGKIVSPGFIDAHSHTDSTIIANPTAESTIRQGVTTEVVGNCGMSLAPMTEEARRRGSGGFGSFSGIEVPACTFGECLDMLDEKGMSGNLAWFVGHNTLRSVADVIGPKVTEDQYKVMENGIREAMDAGALGMSTGLEFEPGRSATAEEITRLAKVVGEYDGFYCSHIRNRDAYLQEAIDEFIGIAKAAGTRGQISHLNVRNNTGVPEGGWQRAVDSIDAARREGMEILTDFTPMNYGIGSMASILPQWVRAEGTERAVQMLRDPATRAKLRTGCDRYWRFIHRGDWHRVRMQSNPAFPEINGKTFPEISRMWGKDPWDCYFDILAEAGPGMDGVVLVAELFTEQHVAEAISHPLFILGVDGYSTKIDGPLATQTLWPLHYMGMIHYLTYHVREKGTLRLEEAIRKMTSMAATHFGMKDRGILRPGYFADVAVFALDKLEEVSTIEQPLAYAKGMDYVIVNGTVVLDEGEHTGAKPGNNLRRS